MFYSPSYKTIDTCCFKKNVGCDCLATEAEPCWGQVELGMIPDEGGGESPIHLCQGHINEFETGKYRKENEY